MSSTCNLNFAHHRLIINNNEDRSFNSCPVYHVVFEKSINELEPCFSMEVLKRLRERGLKLIGSCNGLLCILNSYTPLIYNPDTRIWSALPKVSYGAMHGFGYDESTDDYKVVAITVRSKVKICSLKTGTWKKLGYFPHGYLFSNINYQSYEFGKYSNGALHWAGGDQNFGLVNILVWGFSENGCVSIVSIASFNSCPVYHVVFEKSINELEPCFSMEVLKRLRERGLKLIGSCNGLLCILNSYTPLIYNPDTRIWSALPKVSYGAMHGFGYDESTDDYKVVAITVRSKVKICSLKTGTWKKLGYFPHGYLFSNINYQSYEFGKYSNGALHWAGGDQNFGLVNILVWGFSENGCVSINLQSDLITTNSYGPPMFITGHPQRLERPSPFSDRPHPKSPIPSTKKNKLHALPSTLTDPSRSFHALPSVPKVVLVSMEALRRRFFDGALDNEKKISWIKWSKILSPKKHGGLRVSSLYALNRALLFKWVWRYISQDNSLWARVISSIHGLKIQDHCLSSSSIWNSIVREVRVLKNHGVDLVSYCVKRVGNGLKNPWSC
ncbi:RNA-directed DNA polymerase, eukaryota [Tanacetum coccineum]